MARNVLFIIALAVVIGWALVAARSPGPPGSTTGPAPDVSIASPSGEKISLSDYRGKVVLLDFWATWCGPCRDSIPAIQRTYEKYRERGFEVMGVAMENDDGSGIPSFIQRMGMTYKVGMPVTREELAGYAPRSIPLMVLIDRAGNIQWRQEGYGPGLDDELQSRIENLL